MNDKQIVYNKVFDNEYGKEVLADLRAVSYATKRNEPVDANGRYDPYLAAINEGKRQMFLEIMTIMKIDFDYLYEELEN